MPEIIYTEMNRDYTGGANRYADFSEFAEAVSDLFARPERWN